VTRLGQSPFDDVPVFPLPEVVLFPEAHLPLHIFEPRYRTMLADCLAGDGTLVIASMTSSGRVAKVACLGMIALHRPLADGRSNILVVGAERVRVEELIVEDPPRYPYKRARLSPLEVLDVDVSDTDRTALMATATMFAGELRKHDASFGFRVPAQPSASALADACAFQLVGDASVRQALLEELDPRMRVRMVLDQLAIQHGAMKGASPAKVLH
jgi:Lon protease-like protein